MQNNYHTKEILLMTINLCWLVTGEQTELGGVYCCVCILLIWPAVMYSKLFFELRLSICSASYCGSCGPVSTAVVVCQVL